MVDFIIKMFTVKEEKKFDTLQKELSKNEKALEELQQFNEELMNKNFNLLSK